MSFQPIDWFACTAVRLSTRIATAEYIERDLRGQRWPKGSPEHRERVECVADLWKTLDEVLLLFLDPRVPKGTA